MKELKKQVEAILFSVARFITLEELSKLCKKDETKIKEALLSLMVEYENSEDRSLVILNEGDQWKLTTREEYGGLVRSVVSETELTKTQMETLAVIAFKYPIKQSELIKIRTNKAYDHVMELEKLGFIIRQKYGRSKLIKLTDKFFEYFDLPKEKLKERFKGFEQIAQSIETTEKRNEELKEEQQKQAEEAKKEAEMHRKVMDGEIDLVDEEGEEQKLETYEEEKKEPHIEEAKETFEGMEVVDVEEKTESVEETKSEEEQETESNDQEESSEETNEESQEDDLPADENQQEVIEETETSEEPQEMSEAEETSEAKE